MPNTTADTAAGNSLPVGGDGVGVASGEVVTTAGVAVGETVQVNVEDRKDKTSEAKEEEEQSNEKIFCHECEEQSLSHATQMIEANMPVCVWHHRRAT